MRGGGGGERDEMRFSFGTFIQKRNLNIFDASCFKIIQLMGRGKISSDLTLEILLPLCMIFAVGSCRRVLTMPSQNMSYYTLFGGR